MGRNGSQERVRVLAASGAHQVALSRSCVNGILARQVLKGRGGALLQCEARVALNVPRETIRCRNSASRVVEMDGRVYSVCGTHFAMADDGLRLRLLPPPTFEDLAQLYRLAHPRARRGAAPAARTGPTLAA